MIQGLNKRRRGPSRIKPGRNASAAAKAGKSRVAAHHGKSGGGLKGRRSLHALTEPLTRASQKSGCLFYAPMDPFELGNTVYRVPRFAFIGPGAGDSRYQRLGLFAGIHGDEIAGCQAVVEFLLRLHNFPLLAKGWEIFAYPVCNPTGFEDNTRFSRRGYDLNREFWKNSHEAEVQILEEQILGMQFDGIISLHADDASHGVYGFACGSEITREVLEPALQAASNILPRNTDKTIDGFKARDGIILDCYGGVLGASPETHPRPFEIVLETPQLADMEAQVEAHVAALFSIISVYPGFISYGQDL